MSRSYVRLDPKLPDHKADAIRGEDYPDGALATFVLTMCHAEFQPERGIFRSEAVLRALLGKRSRWVKFLIEHHDLVRQDDGSLYLEGWREWQEGDWQVAERMQRVRNRKRPGTVTPTVTPTVTGTVTPTVTPLSSTSTPSVGRGGGNGGGIYSGGGRPSRRPATNGSIDPEKKRGEAIARARAKLNDPAASEDVKTAARFALDRLGVKADETPFGFEAAS